MCKLLLKIFQGSFVSQFLHRIDNPIQNPIQNSSSIDNPIVETTIPPKKRSNKIK